MANGVYILYDAVSEDIIADVDYNQFTIFILFLILHCYIFSSVAPLFSYHACMACDVYIVAWLYLMLDNVMCILLSLY